MSSCQKMGYRWTAWVHMGPWVPWVVHMGYLNGNGRPVQVTAWAQTPWIHHHLQIQVSIFKSLGVSWYRTAITQAIYFCISTLNQRPYVSVFRKILLLLKVSGGWFIRRNLAHKSASKQNVLVILEFSGST